MNDPTPTPDSDIAHQLGLDQTATRNRRLVRVLTWVLPGLGAVILGLLWLGTGRDQAPQYKTQEARRANLTVAVSATGSLAPTNQVDVGIEMSGTIKSVAADYNDQVKIGQVLARLDTTKLEAQMLQSQAALESARARVLQAQASVRETEAQLARLIQVQELSGGKVPSQNEMDSAKAAVDRARADEASAKAAVSQSKATLDAHRNDLSKAVIRSPINGIVLTRAVEPGQTVAASFQAPVLFTLAESLTQMELHVDVDEADVGKVREGLEASFTVDAYPDRTFPARITQVRYGSKTVAGVVTYETVLQVDNTSMALRPGMTGTASIIIQNIENAVLVPNAALRFTPPVTEPATTGGSGGGLIDNLLPRPPSSASAPRENRNNNNKQQRIWVLKAGIPEPLSITTGATDGSYTEVTGGGLDVGTPVVIDVIDAKR